MTGLPDDGPTPAAIANRLGAAATGTHVLILEAGTTLDPHCIRRLVARAAAEDEPAIVAAHRKAIDGRPIAGHGFFSAPRDVIDLLPEDRLPNDLTGVGTILIRTEAFNAAGGFDLGLADSPILGADLALRVSGPAAHIGRAIDAVTFEPASRSGLHRQPAYRLAPPHAAASRVPEPARHRPQRILWIAHHLPDPCRSGVDARHIQMMNALRSAGSELVVFSAHGTHDVANDRRLEALGIQWMAPPPAERWDLGSGRDYRLDDVLEARRWDTILISHPHLAAGIIPIIKLRAGEAHAIVDLGTVRFPAAHDATTPSEVNDARLEQELAGLAGADAVVTATDQDRKVIEFGDSTLPAFVWAALGEDLPAGSGGALEGSLLYVGDLFHHPNAQGIEWWLDMVAGPVEARVGRPVPLRAVGTGSEVYRAIWRHPGKVLLAGWRPDLGGELARARVLAIPLTYATGTGGRMATALASGLPVAASAPAAALLPKRLADLVQVCSSPVELAEAIADLLTDDSHWEYVRARLLEADIPAMRVAQTAQFVDWLASIEPANREPAAPRPSRRFGSRRGLRRPDRAS